MLGLLLLNDKQNAHSSIFHIWGSNSRLLYYPSNIQWFCNTQQPAVKAQYCKQQAHYSGKSGEIPYNF